MTAPYSRSAVAIAQAVNAGTTSAIEVMTHPKSESPPIPRTTIIRRASIKRACYT